MMPLRARALTTSLGSPAGRREGRRTDGELSSIVFSALYGWARGHVKQFDAWPLKKLKLVR